MREDCLRALDSRETLKEAEAEPKKSEEDPYIVLSTLFSSEREGTGSSV